MVQVQLAIVREGEAAAKDSSDGANELLLQMSNAHSNGKSCCKSCVSSTVVKRCFRVASRAKLWSARTLCSLFLLSPTTRQPSSHHLATWKVYLFPRLSLWCPVTCLLYVSLQLPLPKDQQLG